MGGIFTRVGYYCREVATVPTTAHCENFSSGQRNRRSGVVDLHSCPLCPLLFYKSGIKYHVKKYMVKIYHVEKYKGRK